MGVLQGRATISDMPDRTNPLSMERIIYPSLGRDPGAADSAWLFLHQLGGASSRIGPVVDELIGLIPYLVDDVGRQDLWPLVLRSAETGTDTTVRLARWCAGEALEKTCDELRALPGGQDAEAAVRKLLAAVTAYRKHKVVVTREAMVDATIDCTRRVERRPAPLIACVLEAAIGAAKASLVLTSPANNRLDPQSARDLAARKAARMTVAALCPGVGIEGSRPVQELGFVDGTAVLPREKVESLRQFWADLLDKNAALRGEPGGISPTEEQWASLGADVAMADGLLLPGGFIPLPLGPEEARAWYLAGVGAAEVMNWRDAGVGPEEAALALRLGFTPEDLSALQEIEGEATSRA